MISNEDIEAWREDEKQTQFQEDNRRLADNHVGWAIQVLYPDGWREVGIYDTRKEATKKCLLLIKYWNNWEFRVYEAVKGK